MGGGGGSPANINHRVIANLTFFNRGGWGWGWGKGVVPGPDMTSSVKWMIVAGFTLQTSHLIFVNVCCYDNDSTYRRGSQGSLTPLRFNQCEPGFL